MDMVCAALVVLVWAAAAAAHSTGPPLEACSNGLRPGAPHGYPVQPAGNGGFVVATDLEPLNNGGFGYRAGEVYTVFLVGLNHTFRGWILQAKSPLDAPLGAFIIDEDSSSSGSGVQRLLVCSNAGMSIVTHFNPERKNFDGQEFTWLAPQEENGTVEFYYTVVQTLTVFYSNLRASENMIDIEDIPNVIDMEEIPDLSSVQDDEMATDNSSGLVFRIPPDCTASDCTVFVRISRNPDPSLLTFDLDGTAKAWVAVGFTKIPNMYNADVFACNINPGTGMVQALDTLNVKDSYDNIPHADQSDTALISGSLTDGRIACSFTRTIRNTSDQDFNLNDDYFVLYGRSNNAPLPNQLVTHVGGDTPPPSISSRMINPVTDSGIQEESSFVRTKLALVQTHGILMLISWPLLASTAIFFAVYMRAVLPHGEWFQVHRAFMLASLFLSLVSFVLVFASQWQSSTPGLINLRGDPKRTAHFAIGIILTFLQILNPILSVFRCEPDSERRWIFKLLHGYFVGLIAEILAYVNIGIGLAIFTYSYSQFTETAVPIWLYVAYSVFLVLLFAVILPFFNKWTKNAAKAGKKSPEEIELKQYDSIDQQDGGKLPGRSMTSVFPWVTLGVFTSVTLFVVVVLTVLIVL